jgi:hypothetical protein
MSLHVSRLFLSITALKRRQLGIVDLPTIQLSTEDLLILATEQDITRLLSVEQFFTGSTILTDDNKRVSTEQDADLFLETEQIVFN